MLLMYKRISSWRRRDIQELSLMNADARKKKKKKSIKEKDKTGGKKKKRSLGFMSSFIK